MRLELADYDAEERRREGRRRGRWNGHKAQISPLVQKIPVHIDAVRFTQILGYQSADRRQVLLLELVRVLDVS